MKAYFLELLGFMSGTLIPPRTCQAMASARGPLPSGKRREGQLASTGSQGPCETRGSRVRAWPALARNHGRRS